ncbi:MAG TPA: hypothetical protein VK172_04225 [Lentimicrobium sp.]|nr:hypothetical protein [Lentimicrobium sp.]
MNNITRSFLKQLLIVASIFGIIITGVVLTVPAKYVSPTLPYLLIFHTAATLTSFLYIQKKTSQSPKKFVNVYLANTTVKLLLYLVILMVYAMNYFHDAINFIVSFFIFYVVFTIFEVIHLLKANKNLSGLKE